MADDTSTLKAIKAGILVPYRGQKPPAPDWFDTAIGTAFETAYVDVSGAQIHYQVWGKSDAPGVLLVHGNGAHAHWYDFIAPWLARSHRVVAMTFSGMGDSDWRDKYTISGFSAEQIAVCEAAGLFDHPVKPTLIAHSFGGFVTLQTGAAASDRFGGILIVDSPIRPPEDKWDGPPTRSAGNRIYADLKGALSRFRLAPPQSCANHFIVDHIARHSLKQASDQAGETGWTWKFDPFIWQHFEAEAPPTDLVRRIHCPLTFMRGERSGLVTDRIWSFMQSLRPDAGFVSIPDADHHVMLDQPLAFIAATRTQLVNWQAA